MTLRRSLPFGQEIDLDIGDMLAASQEIVSHQAVEIERRGRAGVDLVINDLRFLADRQGNLAGGLDCLFQREAFGHIENDLELVFVVERQHLHLHPVDSQQTHRPARGGHLT